MTEVYVKLKKIIILTKGGIEKIHTVSPTNIRSIYLSITILKHANVISKVNKPP